MAASQALGVSAYSAVASAICNPAQWLPADSEPDESCRCAFVEVAAFSGGGNIVPHVILHLHFSGEWGIGAVEKKKKKKKKDKGFVEGSVRPAVMHRRFGDTWHFDYLDKGDMIAERSLRYNVHILDPRSSLT